MLLPPAASYIGGPLHQRSITTASTLMIQSRWAVGWPVTWPCSVLLHPRATSNLHDHREMGLMSSDAGHSPCLKMRITWAQLSDCPTLHTESIHPTSARVVQPRHHQEPAPARLYLLLLETESGEGPSPGSPGVGWCRAGAHLQLLYPKCGLKMTALA